MRKIKTLCLGLALMLAGPALAQDPSGPAELPPASYAANSYVDSRGCAFVRVTLGGQASWVPQLTADRRQICGQSPSVAPVVAAPVAVAARPAPAARTAHPPHPTGLRTPRGYSRAWDDDRLNPRRAQGTPEGEAAMNRIWTQEVPRRLIQN